MATTALFLGLAQVANAQAGIKIMVPKSSSFVKINQENVNVRRLPNTTSGKVMSWDSDAGSYDTYSKIFYSDTESNRYRPNKNTGAFVSAYHPQKDEWLVLANNQQTPKDGWYNVIVNAQEYAGNPGHANAKYGWIKADFCSPIEIMTDGIIKNLKFAEECDINPETGEEEYKYYVMPDEKTYQRESGKYSNLKFHVGYNENTNKAWLALATVVDHYLLVARYSIDVIEDTEMQSNICLEEQEDDMGENTYLVAKVKPNNKEASELRTAAYLLVCPDSEFESIINDMFPNHKFPTNEVYVVTKGKKIERLSFETNAIGQEFNTYILN